ncbi:hypothetical protein VIGAN_08255400 [Vigna angularis var. angularis]|uniref:AMP-dependent synthetase/ligase domain-containing protein n=1 Tax=Vigna angularis var. angularis TaxID=157739 RepID=A0A0S3SSE4_PHAAN|nr:hypothetical protein VIGAN_08255400 [Vigna angularis var. angularis]
MLFSLLVPFCFFSRGLLCAGITTVLMQKFDFQDMLDAIQKHKVNNVPAVPPMILALKL